jgi:ApbE superfamily uncharacterized protein (UPF0280 family)
LRLLRRRAKTFDIQVQDLVLHITAPDDFAEESRAAALGFWEQIHSYALRDPEFRRSKRPVTRIAGDAPDVVKQIVTIAARAGVGPMFTFRGAVVDEVGRFLGHQLPEVTVACGGDYFLKSRKRMRLAVKRRGGEPITVAVPAAGVQAILPKPDGFGMALHYLQRVPGVRGAIVVLGDRIGVSGALEIAG